MISDDSLDLLDATETDGADEEAPVRFSELGVPGPIVRALAADGKTTAFPIQADTLPDSLAGRDILGRGRTGSGKTLAFSIPLVARLGQGASDYDGKLPHPRGLVLAPTRELSNQISEVLAPIAEMYGMSVTTVFGGVRYNKQIRELKAGAEIVVACPGRLEDLLRQNALTLEDVQVAVIDEADEMADMGFLPPVKRLLAQIRPDAQHMLFSATLDHGVDEVVNEFLKDPKVHSVDPATNTVDLMTHHVFETTRADKHELVRTLASGTGRRILFTRTKFQAKKLAKNLTQHGIPAAELHGNLNQSQRDRNLNAFETGDVNVMVATDVAARGIDVSGVELVMQVEPPADPKSFLHRSGRTARAGRAGDVVTIVLPEQRNETRRLLKTAGIKVRGIEVTHDSPEVLELVGEKAEPVFGWELKPLKPAKPVRTKPAKAKASKPAGGSRRRRADADRFASDHQDRFDAPAFEETGGKRRHTTKRDGFDRRDRRDRFDRDDRFDRGGRHDRDDRRNREDRDDRFNRDDRRDRRDRNDRAAAAPKRIHRKHENRIVRDERTEAAKRHDRRVNARRGNAGNLFEQGLSRHHGKKRNRAPFLFSGR